MLNARARAADARSDFTRLAHATESAVRTERFRERAHVDVHVIFDPGGFHRAAAGRAHHERRVRLVHHQAHLRVSRSRRARERGGRRVAVHGEEGVGDDEFASRV